MAGFLEKYKVPIVMKSSNAHYPKQHMFVIKKRRINPKERCACTREVEDALTGLLHFHYGNDTELADEPVDPASEQNHLGPSGQFLTNLDSSGSVGVRSGILRV